MINLYKKCFLLILITFSCHSRTIRADDPPAFDLNALANIATSLGGNSQIMSLVSSLFNQHGSGAGNANQKSQSPISNLLSTATTVGSAATSADPTTGNSSDSFDSNLLGQDPLPGPVAAAAPPAPAPATSSANATKTRQPTTGAPQPAPLPIQTPTASSSSNPMSGLMSLLPNVLPGLGGLFNNQQNKAAATATASTGAGGSGSNQASAGTTLSQPTSVPTQGANNARGVINQVLTAYASGQIPNELIQLGLSGKVPPQIIELALSGQVPSQMIQMIITGQVPMSTINAFLATIQGASSNSASNGQQLHKNEPSQQQQQPPGITKILFEALFNRQSTSKEGNQSGSGFKMPTLLGPVGLPNMRKFGQFVGGTITNVASMIPF